MDCDSCLFFAVNWLCLNPEPNSATYYGNCLWPNHFNVVTGLYRDDAVVIWQKVAQLKLIEGRPTSEVCDQLSISEKACYSRVSRIRKYIGSLLKREDWP